MRVGESSVRVGGSSVREGGRRKQETPHRLLHGLDFFRQVFLLVFFCKGTMPHGFFVRLHVIQPVQVVCLRARLSACGWVWAGVGG